MWLQSDPQALGATGRFWAGPSLACVGSLAPFLSMEPAKTDTCRRELRACPDQRPSFAILVVPVGRRTPRRQYPWSCRRHIYRRYSIYSHGRPALYAELHVQLRQDVQSRGWLAALLYVLAFRVTIEAKGK